MTRRAAGVMPWVSAMKSGVRPIGSMITNSVTKAEIRNAVSMRPARQPRTLQLVARPVLRDLDLRLFQRSRRFRPPLPTAPRRGAARP